MAVHTVDDESFAAYVAVRWSMLYRLASLLAGPSGADALTRAALVRAYLSWPEVQESGPADVEVTRYLAEAAANAPAAMGIESADGDDPGSRLWAGISALPPQQRTLLVLRHYERFSEAEIAGALHRSRSSVATELLALETGIDLDDLRDELFRRSEETHVPFPPVVALLAEAHRTRRDRRRRAWGWAAGVAVTVALALVVASLLQQATGGQQSAPARDRAVTFLSMLPVGASPRVAYSTGRSLHLGGGRDLTLPDLPATMVQTKKWLFVAGVSGGITRIDTATGDTHTVTDTSRGQLVTDPAGEHIAWLASGAGPAAVVVRTVWDWAVPLSDEQPFPVTPRCCDNPFLVNGLTRDRQVVTSWPAGGRAWVWQMPDGGSTQVHELAGLRGGVIIQVAAAGVVVRRGAFEYVVGRLERGGFVQAATLSARVADFSDPHGHRVVLADEDGEIHVREIRFRGRSRRGAQDVRMQLPTIPAGYSRARWEDADHVLLEVADASMPYGALVRCVVGTGACERAVTFDAGPHQLAD